MPFLSDVVILLDVRSGGGVLNVFKWELGILSANVWKGGGEGMEEIHEAEKRLRSISHHIYELNILMLVCKQAADAYLECLKEGEPDWGTVFSTLKNLSDKIEDEVSEMERYFNVKWIKAKGLYKAAP